VKEKEAVASFFYTELGGDWRFWHSIHFKCNS